MTALGVAIQRLPHGADLDLPAYQSAGAAGLDLCAALTEEVILDPGARTLVPTGFAIALPDGYEAQVRPRSGLAARHGVTVLNAPGTVDADYRGEVKVLLVNLGQAPFAIRRGLRVAQLVVAPVTRVRWEEAPSLPASARAAGGFGSTDLTSTGLTSTGLNSTGRSS
jgi:dUTP pyrophosphatase